MAFKPKYATLAEQIRADIRRGRWKPGDRLPTVSELLKEGDYSQPTIQHAMRLLLEEGLITRKRRQGTIVAGGNAPKGTGDENVYDIYMIAQELRDIQRHPYVWFVTDSLAKGVVGANRRHRLRFLAKDALATATRENPGPKAYFSFGGSLDPNLKDLPADVVIVTNNRASVAFAPTNAVNYDAVGSSYLAVTRLIHDLGHRDIAMIWGGPGPYYRDPFAGYRLALTMSGLPFDERLVVNTNAGVEAAGREAAMTLLERGVKFTAVFVDTDPKALGAMALFQEKGLAVPEDVSVLGMDDIPGVSDAAGLTTVHKPFAEMGAAMVGILDKIVASGGRPVPSEAFYGTLVHRRSCAAAPTTTRERNAAKA